MTFQKSFGSACCQVCTLKQGGSKSKYPYRI